MGCVSLSKVLTLSVHTETSIIVCSVLLRPWLGFERHCPFIPQPRRPTPVPAQFPVGEALKHWRSNLGLGFLDKLRFPPRGPSQGAAHKAACSRHFLLSQPAGSATHHDLLAASLFRFAPYQMLSVSSARPAGAHFSQPRRYTFRISRTAIFPKCPMGLSYSWQLLPC